MDNKTKSSIILVSLVLISFILGLFTGLNIDKLVLTTPRILVDNGTLIAEHKLDKGINNERKVVIKDSDREAVNKLIKAQIKDGRIRVCTGRPICTYIKPHTYKLGGRFNY